MGQRRERKKRPEKLQLRSTAGWLPFREDNCRDLARYFGVEPAVMIRAFLGEDWKLVEVIRQYALEEEAVAAEKGEPFDAAGFFRRFAKKRKTGINRPEDNLKPFQEMLTAEERWGR